MDGKSSLLTEALLGLCRVETFGKALQNKKMCDFFFAISVGSHTNRTGTLVVHAVRDRTTALQIVGVKIKKHKRRCFECRVLRTTWSRRVIFKSEPVVAA